MSEIRTAPIISALLSKGPKGPRISQEDGDSVYTKSDREFQNGISG